MQGWVVGSEGFSRTETIAIVLAFVVDLAWMIWLVVVAWRMQDSEAPAPWPMKAWTQITPVCRAPDAASHEAM